MSPGILVWNLDHSGEVIYVDAAWVALTGQAREQAIGSGWQSHIHPEDLPIVLGSLEKARSACRNFTVDTRVRRTDGTYTWFLTTAIAQVDRAGVFTGYLGTFVDIAERKLAEIALQESEMRLRRILENMPVLLFANDHQPVPVLWNQECERVTGYSAAEIIGNPQALHLLYPDEQELKKIIEQGEEHRGDYRDWEATLTRKDGEKRTISWTSIAKMLPIDGWANWSIGVDVTHRKRAEQHTQALQALTSHLSEALTPQEVTAVVLSHVQKLLPDAHTAGILVPNVAKQLFEFATAANIERKVLAQYQTMPFYQQSMIWDAYHTKQAIWIPDIETYAALYPEAAAGSPARGTFAVSALPLMIDQNVIGVLALGFTREQNFEAEEREFIETIVQQCAQALERVRLGEQAQIAIAMQERQRLARDLHDAVSQTLFSATTMAEALPRMWERDPQKTLQLLHQIKLLNRAALAEMRTLLIELRPETILKTDLKMLIRHLLEAAKGRKYIETHLVIPNNEIFLPPDVHIALYRITQEAINNILKHSQATEFTVEVALQEKQVSLLIRDNGRGFDSNHSFAGIGLSSMAERAAAVEATFEIQSSPGAGTQIRVECTL